MTNQYVRVITCLLCATACARAGAPATTQSLEQRMIALAPVLSLDDPETKSLDVQLVFDAGTARLLIRALYDGPGRRAMYVSDPRDGTPLCVLADDRLILYDPIDGVLRIADRATGRLEFRQVDENLKLDFDVHASLKGELSKPWKVVVDLTSVVTRRRDAAAEDLGSGVYGLRLRGKKPGTMLYAAIDPRRPCPYLRLELSTDGKPGLVLDPITCNEPVDPAAFNVPANDDLAKRIPVQPWPDEGLLAGAQGAQVFMQILFTRLAIDDPKWRAQLGQNWVTRVNWDKVKENDAKLAPVLRELFPLAVAAPSGGGRAATKPAADSNSPATNRAP